MELKYETDMLITESRQFFLPQTVHFRTFYHNPSGIRLVQCTHNLKQGSLSCPTRPHNAHHFTLFYHQVYTFQDL